MRAAAAILQCAILGSFAIGFSAIAPFGNCQEPHKMKEPILAEEQADALKSWDEVYRSFKAFAQYDDGAIAEGYSDSISRLLSDDWNSVSQLNQWIAENKNFEKFVFKHIDELMTPDQAKKIRDNAETLCPKDAGRLCKAICDRLSEVENYIYLQNLLAHVKRINREDFQPGEVEAKEAAGLLQYAAANHDRLFQNMSDSDAFSLAEAIDGLELRFSDGMDSQWIQAVWNSFLKRHPGSPDIDKARWLQAKRAANPYEYEESADAALRQIDIIEQFIKKYPPSSCIPEAELELARACRIAYETFRFGNGLRADPVMNRQMAGRKYYDRASRLLERLCAQSSDPVRSDACQALSDLAEGRCVYMGPGSPNPGFADHWRTNGEERNK